MKNKKDLLTGKAEFRISKNDMFWSCCILDMNNNFEFFHIKWDGYNDANWWNNVSEKASVKTCKGDKGTVKKFKLNYRTLEVVEVEEGAE